MTLDNIGAICQARGVAKVSPQKAAEAKEDLIILEDLGQLFNLTSAAETMREKISAQGLTPEANSLYSGAFAGIRESDPLKRTLLAVDATLEAIDGIKSARKRKAFASDQNALNKIKEIILTTQNAYANILNKLSPATGKILKQILSTVQGPFGILEVPKLVRSTIQNISLNLSDPIKSKLGIGKSGWMEKLSRKNIESVVAESCQNIKYVRVEIPTSRPTLLPPVKKSPFNYSASAGGGYAYAAGRSELRIGRENGVTGTAAASGSYLFNERLTLQLYYLTQATIKSNFSQLQQGADEALAAVNYQTKKSDLQLRLGWAHYSATAENDPNRHGLQQDARFVYRLNPRLSLNVDESLFSGLINANWKNQVRLEPGVTLKIKGFSPFLGGIGGYDQFAGKIIYGGFAGVYKELSVQQEFNLRIDYTNLRKLEVAGRYFFLHPLGGIGPLAYYNFDFDNKTHAVSGGVAAYLSLGELLKRNIPLDLLFNGQCGYSTSATDNAKFCSGMLMLRWSGRGSLQLPMVSPLRPDNTRPLPEGR